MLHRSNPGRWLTLGVAIGAFLLAVAPSCGPSACKSDADCKGDRICDGNSGTCIDPPANSTGGGGDGGGGDGGGGGAGASPVANCDDSAKNGDETDVDCGGSCAPCDIGETCGVAGDCLSGFCDANTCALCMSDTDCADMPSFYCKGGFCVAQRTNGDPCLGPNECGSGFCPVDDGVCCDTECANTCVGCLAVKTSDVTGLCSPVTVMTDPDGECGEHGYALCAGAGTCFGEHLWSAAHGGDGQDLIEDVAVDSAGGVYITGYFYDTVSFGGDVLTSVGQNDIFVAKFEANGDHAWSKSFGDTGIDAAYGITVDGNDLVVVVGHFAGTVSFGGTALDSAGEGDVFLTKLDSDGNYVWSKRFGDEAADKGNAVAVDPSNDILIVGHFFDQITFEGAPLTSAGANYDGFVAKLDSNGNPIWSTSFGDTSGDSANGVASDSQEAVVVSGFFAGTVNFGGANHVSGGSEDGFVAKWDTDGNPDWSVGFGAEGNQYAVDVATDGSDSVVIAGFFSGAADLGGGDLVSAGSQDVLAAKFDKDGKHVWSKSYGDGAAQHAHGVAANGAGSVALVGAAAGTVDFGAGSLAGSTDLDVFVAMLDSDGEHLWSKRFGDNEPQTARAIAFRVDGSVVVAGELKGLVDFGGFPVNAVDATDGFVGVFGP